MDKTRNFQLKGDKAIRNALLLLGPKVGKKVVNKAIRNGLKPILADARKRIRGGEYATGFSASRIKVRASSRRRTGVIALDIRVGEKDYVGKTFYAAMVEYGTAKMEARPFMRPAFEANKDKVIKLVLSEIKAGVMREARAK